MKRLCIALAAFLVIGGCASAGAGKANLSRLSPRDTATTDSTAAPTSPAPQPPAPLPPADGGLLRPVKLVYRGEAVIMANRIPFELHRSLAKAMAGDRPIWRVTSQQKMGGGGSVDTFDLDVKSLAPIRWSAAQSQASVALDFAPSAVTGKMVFGPNEMPFKVELAAPVYGDGSSLEILLGALPLAPGYATGLRVFDFQTQGARAMKLSVTGIETVEVPAGRYECHRVEIAGMEGEPPSVVFVCAKDPRVLVRAHFELPAAAGGGFADMDLASIE